MEFPKQQLIIPLAMVAGVVAGWWLTGWIAPVVIAVLALLFYFLLLRITSSLPSQAMRYGGLHWVWIVMFSFALGQATYEFHRPQTLSASLSPRSMAVGEVEDVRQYSSRSSILVNVKVVSSPGKSPQRFRNLRVMLSAPDASPRVGDLVEFPAHIEEVTDSRNVLASGRAERLRLQGILYQCNVAEDGAVAVTGHRNSLRAYCAAWRDDLEVLIEKSGLNRSTVDFLVTVLLSDRDFLATERRELFSDAGVAHMLAVSGMHVGIVFGIITVLLFPFSLLGFYKWRYLLALPAIWFYVFLTGCGPSTLRAGILITFYVAGLLLERRNYSIGALCWAAFFIILFDPFAIFDIGFQLSFLCVAALLVFTDKLVMIDQRHHNRLYRVVQFLTVTFVASLASWPLVAYYFGRIPLMFLPANIIALPLLPFYIALALLHLLITALFGTSPALLVGVLDGAYSLFESFLGYTSFEGATTLRMGVGLPTVLLWLMALAGLAFVLYRGKKPMHYAAGVAALVLAAASVPVFAPAAETDGIIFRDTFPTVELAVYRGGEEEIVAFPKGNIAEYNSSGKKIVCIDNRLPDAPSGSAPFRLPGHTDYVIIAGNYRGSLSAVDSICSHLTPRPVILLHPSVRKEQEETMLREADSLRLSLHSLRRDGPLRLFYENR